MRIYYADENTEFVNPAGERLPPAPGFASVDKTWQYARRVDPRIPKEEVADFIRKQSIDQDMQRARRLGTFLPTGALDQIELDLADFSAKVDGVSSYGLREGVPPFALVGIDVFSKKIAVVPMRAKGQGEVVLAIDDIVQRVGKTPAFRH
jgi:hypothetical protein